MSARVFTARVAYGGPDRFDITRKSGGPAGHPFAPSAGLLYPMKARAAAGPVTAADMAAYFTGYRAEMRASLARYPSAWAALIARDEVTLVCYCTQPAACHRTVLALLLVERGATYLGERPATPPRQGSLALDVPPPVARMARPGEHHCHAADCRIPTKPELLMCRKHWFMVPLVLRNEVLRHFNPRQCAAGDRIAPTRAWWIAAETAIAAVARAEGKLAVAEQYERYAAAHEARTDDDDD